MKIISISGLDGSGKSTQIELLKQHFEADGKKVYYFHTNQFSISKTYNILRPHKVIKKTHNESVSRAGWPQIQLRKLAFLIDTWRFKGFCRKLEAQNVDFLLTDRFFFDSLVNITFLEGKNAPSWLEKFLPRPDYAFYLQIAPGVIMQRQRVPEQGLAYLEAKKVLFDIFAPKWNLQIIDGNRSTQEISSNIISYIK